LQSCGEKKKNSEALGFDSRPTENVSYVFSPNFESRTLKGSQIDPEIISSFLFKIIYNK